MDRLLCGDVGVGKTEVALRAAFKCVMGGKQCAILAPTTLLAWQHYNTIISRMEAFPVKVGMLSRFRTAKQQKETLRGFAAIVDGKCDDLPEWAFFNVGTLDDARKKAADKLAEEKGGEA